MQDNSKAKHKYQKNKPKGLYTSKDRHYVYGDNTVRNKGKLIKVLYVVLPFVMVVIIAGGFFLGYYSYKNDNSHNDKQTETNEDYISLEQQKTLYTIVSVAEPLDRSYEPEITDFQGVAVSTIIEVPLKQMVTAAKNDGVDLSVAKGYVSYDDQHTMYVDYVNSLVDTGKYTEVRAESVANRKVCDSGNSERQLGLLVEFACEDKDKFNETEQYQWLAKHGADYGFVQRYTESGEQITAMDNDYTLWRYIGKDNALLARKLGLDFNNLIAYLKS